MKKILLPFLSGLALFSTVLPMPAADRATEIVARLAAGFRTMKSYTVNFEATMGNFRAAGNYSVDGGNYYLTLGDAEVYTDGRNRYEVDNRRKEVTVTEVDTSDRNMLNNPVHAFDFLGDEYTPSLLWEHDGEAAILLKPTPGQTTLAGNITLVVATQTMQPRSVDYEFDGEHITVRILGIEPLRGALPVFDAAARATYEWIDFR